MLDAIRRSARPVSPASLLGAGGVGGLSVCSDPASAPKAPAPRGHRIVAVTGATGFVGSRLVRVLLRTEMSVRAVVRATRAVAPLRDLGCEVALGDVQDARSLEQAFAGCDAVVHLVAVLRERGSVTYDAVNRAGTANVVAAAKRQGADRIVHFSALGAGPHATRYLRSKWAGEEEVRTGGVQYVIFRPSFLIGLGGGAAAQFADIVRLGPWYPLRRVVRSGAFLTRLGDLVPIVPILGSGQSRFMPVHLDDVLDAVKQALSRDDVLGETYEVGGPDIVTYEHMMATVAEVLGLRRWAVHVPLAAAWAMVRLFAVLPDPPITADEFEALLRDNVCDNTRVQEVFRLSLRPFRVAVADALRESSAA